MKVDPASSRSLVADLWTGFLGRCPHCRRGRIFGRFLKVNDACPVCGEELRHHRADDLPAYLVIVVVGHIVVPATLYVETHFAPPYWVHAALWLPLTIGLTLGLLQPVKGAVVAMQWHLGMHGFAEAKAARRPGNRVTGLPVGCERGITGPQARPNAWHQG